MRIRRVVNWLRCDRFNNSSSILKPALRLYTNLILFAFFASLLSIEGHPHKTLRFPSSSLSPDDASVGRSDKKLRGLGTRVCLGAWLQSQPEVLWGNGSIGGKFFSTTCGLIIRVRKASKSIGCPHV